MFKVALSLSVLSTTLIGCNSSPVALQSPQLEQEVFFTSMADLQGQHFEGRAVFMIEPDSPFDGARLFMHVESVNNGVMRVPFLVDDDHSRTWILTMTSDGLHLLHDHRYPDGRKHDLTDYGGWADGTGTALRQSFPADEATKQMLPAASTNVWTLEFQPETQRFIYDLQRHGQPRFRAEFDLSRPLDRGS